MGGSHLLSLYSATQASRLRRFTATNLPFSIRRNKQGRADMRLKSEHRLRRKSSKRVAEEKSRQGFPAQSVEKAQDVVVEVTGGESTSESVKEDYKEDLATGDFHKTGKDKQ